MLDIANRLRYRRLRNGKLGGSLSHAAALRHGHQNMQIAQLEAASDTIVPVPCVAHEQIIMSSSNNRIIGLWAGKLVFKSEGRTPPPDRVVPLPDWLERRPSCSFNGFWPWRWRL